MGKGKGPVIGSRYLMGLHMGISRGPVDELVVIKVGDKEAWSGSETGNTTFDINKPDLYGGDKGQGGINGSLDVLMGAPDQEAPAWLSDLHGALLPGFRGVFTLAFNGEICALNPNPQPWSVRCRRALKGWPGDAPWYPTKAVISLAGDTIKAMNPVHIIYQCIVDKSFGRGLDAGYLDDAAFRAAADQCYSEGFGLCLRWTRTSAVNDFVQTVVNHVGATLGLDYSTGLLTIELIRDDYDPDDLPLFTPDTGLVSIEDDTSTAQETQINEVVVQWVDPITNDDKQTRVPNVAAVQNMGGVVSRITQYPGIPTEDLAQRLALRDVTAATSGLRGFRTTLDRRGYKLRPGLPFRISVPERGIENMVLRAGKKQDGTLSDGKIVITALQDVFGLPDTTWVAPSPSEHIPPDQTPQPCPEHTVTEADYRDLAQQFSPSDLAMLSADAGYIATMGERPTPLALSYTPDTKATGDSAFVPRGVGHFSPTGLIDAAIAENTTTITIADSVDLSEVELGTAALIDAEIVRIDALDLATGIATIARGCADTIPAPHDINARIWCYEDFAGSDNREYVDAEVIQVKLLTHTASGDLDPSLAPIDSVTMASRQFRPYPPAGLTINGQPWFAPDDPVITNISLAWLHRDRIIQSDLLVDYTETSIGPETGVTYTLRVYDDTDTLIDTVSGISGDSTTYTPDADGTYTIELESARDSVASLQKYRVTLDFLMSAPTTAVTLDPAHHGSYMTLSGGNLTGTSNGFTGAGAFSTATAVSTGKFYFEALLVNNANYESMGIFATTDDPQHNEPGNAGDGYGYEARGLLFHGGGYIGTGVSYTTGDIIGCAVDIGAGKIWFRKNGTWIGGGDPASGTSPTSTIVANTYNAAIGTYATGGTWTVNFGTTAYIYAAPAGFGNWT